MSLEPIRTELHARKGHIRRIAHEVGISYDTVRRVMLEPDYEPGFSKVQKLAEYLKVRVCVGGRNK
jgi:hypothetical protein